MVLSPGRDLTRDVDALASYLPSLVLRDLAAHPGEIVAPRMATTPAAVLFADLAGFTALAEELSGKGPRGAEELSRVIDAHFGRLTDIVLRAGGDVLAYAGDAALVAWPAHDRVLPIDALTSAASSGLKLQAPLEQAGANILRMRVSIGVGELTRMMVGGVDGRWLFLARGTPITQATRADQLAAPGEVLVSPEAAAFLGAHCDGVVLEGGALRLTRMQSPPWIEESPVVQVVPNTPRGLRTLVPDVITARVDSGLGEWVGEFRRVTMVFCGLGALDQTGPEALAVIHGAVAALQSEVARFEGTVYQLLTDDKGTTLVAAFGLPTRSHEDDAARGALAALAMRDSLTRLGLSPSLGVATGSLYCGVYGTPRRRQYTVAGQSVNIAARLMQQAGGSVLCDGATEEAAGRYRGLQFTRLPPLRIKGREEPLAVYRPSVETNQVPAGRVLKSDVRPLGRDSECDILDAALEALQAHRSGGLIVLQGEPGIGKSRLIEYVRGRADGRGTRVLACNGNEIEKSTAYHAWSPALRELAGSDPHDAAHRLGLGPRHTSLVPLLAPLLNMDLGESELTHGMTEEVRAANIRKLLLDALDHLAVSGPLVVTVEDAHWLDSPSLALLLGAARSLANVLFAVTSRPLDDPPPDFTALVNLAGSGLLRLEPLGRDAVGRMLADRLDVRSVPDSLLTLVWERAAGNPFFSEELGYALRDYGLVVFTANGCELADPTRELAPAFAEALATRGLPPTVQGVVTSRIDRLGQAEQFALKVASVIGRAFPVAMLREVYPVATTIRELDATLAELERLDLIRKEAGNQDPSFIFRHAITQQVAYDLTLYGQRRDLHQAVGEWLEKHHDPDLSPVLPLLAFHWRRAEAVPKAVLYASRAGEQAFGSFANAEAVGFFRDALSLGAQASQSERMWWEMQAGRACVNWSRYDEGEEHLKRGLSLAGERVPAGVVTGVGDLLTQTLRQALHRNFPDRFIGQRTREREKLLAMARVHEALVEVFYLRDASLSCLNSAMRGLNLAELAGPSPELARFYATVGAILGFIPLRGHAEAYCRRALDTAREVHDVPAAIWTALTVGAYKVGVGSWQEALALFATVTEQSERLGDARRWDDGIQFLTDIHLLQGRFETSLELAGQLCQSAARRNDPRGQASGVQRRVLSLLALGEDAAALQGVEALTTLRWNVGTVHGDLPLSTLRVLTALRVGDVATARRVAIDASRMLAKLNPAYHGYVFDAAGISDALLQILETPGAADATSVAELTDALGNALGALKRLARVFPIGRPWQSLLAGRAERHRGRPDRAFAAWHTAVTLGEQLEMPYPAALAHLELAASLPSDDPTREAHQESARHALTDLKAVRDLNRLKAFRS